MEKNKVLFFAQSGVGGGERMTVNIAKSLDISKYEVVFYLVHAPLGVSDLQDFIPADYRVERLENKGPVHLTNEFRKVLKREMPDMVFCSAMHYNRKLLFLSPLFSKCKFIVRNENYLFTRTKAQKFLMSLSYPLADLIITQTEEMSDELVKAFRLKKNRVVCVHNPVDTKLVDSKLEAADSVAVPKKPEGAVRYIAVGRFMQQKGFDLLAEAFKYVVEKQPKSQLIILGSNDGNCAGYYNRVKQMLCDYGIADKVIMPGFTDNPYAYEIKSDCFVLSSRYEGLPNVLIEALYLGIPAAAFKCIPIIERIVEEGKTGFLAEKEDVQSLAEAMLKAPKLGKIKSTYKSSTPEDFANLFDCVDCGFINLLKVGNLQWGGVKSYSDLKEYIKADFERQGMKHPFIASLTFGEHALTRRYLAILRHVEYYTNRKRTIFNVIPYAYYKLRYRRMCIKYGMYILPNTCGAGLLLPHPGYVRVDSFVKMGSNCTILPMVLFGKKTPDVKDATIEVGDNCYFSTGSTILGPVKIGSNVIVAAGAVVNKDIPDNAVVGGVPAKVIKITNNGRTNQDFISTY